MWSAIRGETVGCMKKKGDSVFWWWERTKGARDISFKNTRIGVNFRKDASPVTLLVN